MAAAEQGTYCDRSYGELAKPAQEHGMFAVRDLKSWSSC